MADISKINVNGVDYDIKDSGLTENINASNAGAHNSIYRGKLLGTAVTSAQYTAISNGTFEDLYIGDYWEIGGVKWTIAGLDYYFNTGESYMCTTHHAVIVPNKCLSYAQMNSNGSTAGGYANSTLRATGLNVARTTINSVFNGHVLTYRGYLSTAVANGCASNGAWYDCNIEIMPEAMVYGAPVFSSVTNGSIIPANYKIETYRLPIFGFDSTFLYIRDTYWLRDVASSVHCTSVAVMGIANLNSAGDTIGVRPSFCLKG